MFLDTVQRKPQSVFLNENLADQVFGVLTGLEILWPAVVYIGDVAI